MATLQKCETCKLGPRYAFKEDDKICAKCKMNKMSPNYKPPKDDESKGKKKDK